jgi:type I restriction enzyme S subunit
VNDGWQAKRVGDVCEVIAGQSPEGRYYNADRKGTPFYQGKKNFGEKYLAPPTTWTLHTTKTAREADILMSVRAPVGPINVATEPICIGRGLAAIRANASLDREFLYYQLLHLQPQIAGTEGAVFASINKSQIEALGIAVAPLPEQRRIVGILDEAFEGIAVAKANAERNLHNARAIFQSHLQSVFAEKGEGWTDTTLEKVLAVQPQNGWSPPSANHSDSGTPVLTLSSVTGFDFRPDKIKFTSAPTDSRRNYWVKSGDLLITRSNTPELVGHVAIVSELIEPTIYPDLIMRMNPMADRIVTEFLYYQMRSPSLRKEITGRAQGANPTMKKISNAAVRTLPITVPPMVTQRAIVKTLDGLATETAGLRRIYESKLTELEALKKALLRQAFTGQLGSQAA